MSVYLFKCCACGCGRKSSRFKTRKQGRPIPNPCHLPLPHRSSSNDRLCNGCYNQHLSYMRFSFITFLSSLTSTEEEIPHPLPPTTIPSLDITPDHLLRRKPDHGNSRESLLSPLDLVLTSVSLICIVQKMCNFKLSLCWVLQRIPSLFERETSFSCF